VLGDYHKQKQTPAMVIKVVLKIHNHGSKKIKEPILPYNYGSQKKKLEKKKEYHSTLAISTHIHQLIN
jgi:hypothetical protein